MSKTIFFSGGEPSGDQHAARLIDALRDSQPEWNWRGFGGPKMQAAGCRIDLDLTAHAVVGLLEVLPKLRQFFRFVDQAEALFASGQVDAVVLVDFPGFNWHIARRAKRYGIPVIYYCPPQLWAWGGWRIAKMKATVDHVLAVLPIEETFFGGHGIDTAFVGHPFFDAVESTELETKTLGQLRHAAAGGRTVAVLPGSRSHEVQRNWPLMLAAMRRLAQQHTDVRFAVAAHRDKQAEFCQHSLAPDDLHLPIDFYVGETSEVIESADCAMMVSGSVSLELMARRVPAAVVYRVGRFLYAFGRCVVKVDTVTLPNLMQREAAAESALRDQPADAPAAPPPSTEEEFVFPEMISVGDPRPAVDFLVSRIDRMLGDPAYLRRKQQILESLVARYAQLGASRRAADQLIAWLGESESAVVPPARVA